MKQLHQSCRFCDDSQYGVLLHQANVVRLHHYNVGRYCLQNRGEIYDRRFLARYLAVCLFAYTDGQYRHNQKWRPYDAAYKCALRFLDAIFRLFGFCELKRSEAAELASHDERLNCVQKVHFEWFVTTLSRTKMSPSCDTKLYRTEYRPTMDVVS